MKDMKKAYIVPYIRVVQIGIEGEYCEPSLGMLSKGDDPDMPILVREEDDDLWNDPNMEWEKPSGVWDNAW